ncbi:T9SS type A sorting domain-containing protein [Flavobacterium sp. LHD-80]|uniref:T9SS type A sorting domain-containing protein n=1 Tax=Flavobacterium sp. LHD-80 TaxID=3071411 RepID=UPI0027DFE24E|nr:T9SS type A sorting domain-containing protein [Flavobacterium sp. LHD-80]MDQ6470215.1 T9SS type A sorting domain-containing protein [Flavobacterium sp. LHD-80]
MKKTLLCFLLLFSNLFYAQVAFISVCEGTSFNLTSLKTDFIGNLNPAETTVTYFLSENDALSNTNAIVNPTTYKGSVGTIKIYGRIDNNGTITSNYFNLTTFPAINVTASHKPILCKGETTALSLSSSGGNAPYLYSVNGSAFTTNDYYNNLPAGTYNIEVKSQNAICLNTKLTYVVPEPTALVATYSIVNQNVIIVTANGGTGPYQYSLNGVDYQSSNVFSNAIPGNYTIRVRDSEGCGTTINATVVPFLNVTAFITKDLDCSGNGNNGIITATATGGQGPYTYSIDNGFNYQSFNVFNNLSAGTYTIKAKDALNSVTNPFAITIAPLINVTGVALVTNATSCSNASILVQATSGQAPFYYSIDNGQTFTNSNVFNNLATGNYVFLIKDSRGCVSATISNTVMPPLPPPTITAANTPVSCKGGTTTLTITATGGRLPYQYSINNGAYTSSKVFANLQAGNHIIKVKDDTGCASTLPYTITEPTAVNADMVIDGNKISILNVTGGSGSYLYSLDNGVFQTNNIFTNIVTGSHLVRVKDSNNCESGSFWAEITSPISASIAITKPLDCTSNAEIAVTATGGFTPYVYSINNGTTFQTSNIFTNLVAGTYTITVKDNDNKLYTKSITISPLTPIYADFLIDKQTLTINGQAGTAPYQYSVDGSSFQANNVFTNLSPGQHQVYIKDSKGCQSFAFLITIENANPLIASAALTKEADCISNANIAATATGGTPPYTYSINGGVTFQSTNVFNNVNAGTYSIVVKDANNNLATSNNLTVLAVSSPTISVTQRNISCYQSNDGSINIIAQGGKAPYVYSINNSTFVATNVFTNLFAGVYNVTVKDANGCLNSYFINIGEPDPIAINLSTTKSTNGNNGKITVDATGGVAPYKYALTSNGIPSNVFQSSNIFDGLQTGSYSVQVKDANGCIAMQMISIIDGPPQLLVTATATQITCTNTAGSITMNATGGTPPYIYSFDNGTTYTASNTYYGFQGTYLIKVKDAENVEATTTVDLVAPTPITATTATLIKAIDCTSNATVIINVVGGTGAYEYSINGSVYSPSNIFTDLGPGTYQFSVKDGASCISLTNNLVIEPLVPLTASATNTVFCRSEYGSVTITASGGRAPYQYSLKNDIYTSSNTFDQVSSGNYTIKVKDANDCIFILPYTIIEPANMIGRLVVEGKTASIVDVRGGSGSYLYSLNDGELQSSNVFTNLSGSNWILVYDSLGCFGFAHSFVIEDPTALKAKITITKPIDCTTNSGTISVAASGGQSPYEYSINGGTNYQTSNIFSNLTAGTYTVWVKDAKGTVNLENSITLTSTSPIIATTTITKAITCIENATVTVTATGGVSPYTYSSNGSAYQTNNIFNNLAAGSYIFYIKDVNGCITAKSITILQPEPLSLANTATNSTTVNSNDGKITITASGGTAPYFYSLKNESGIILIAPQSSPIFEGLSVGKYTIEVVDAKGCLANKTGITITSSTLFGSLIIKPITCASLGSITVNAAGGKYPHQYSFDNGVNYSSSNIASNLQAGNYTIKVKDAGGDILTLSASLTAVSQLIATTAITSPIHCNGSKDAVIQVTVSEGKAPYAYSLNGNAYQTSNIFSNLSAGTHTIAVKDTNDCSTIMAITITEPNVLISTAEVINQTIKVNATGGSGGYRYAISPNLNQFSVNNTFSNLTPGTYSIITSDLNGCIVIMDAVVDPIAPTINGQNKSTVEFKAGQTLADLVIDGQDIKWYSTPGNSSSGKTSKSTAETPLPLTTVLVDGTTYYASQTINGIESKERLAVTAKVNGSLSAPDFNLTAFQFYPNPVQDILTIKNNSIINDVEIIDVTGKSVVFKKINDLQSEIDLSNLSSGVYLMKVKSEGREKTIKIIKK